jgi:IMP cyclohydrolase
MPRPGHEGDLQKNPYIAYHCLRFAGTCAVATNGSHTDPITEKIAAGMAPRDALALSLLALDYEKDQLDTPRVAGVVDRATGRGWLGIVRKDALLVREMPLAPGKAFYIATYEHNAPDEAHVDAKFAATTAEAACAHILCGGVFADLEKPVTAAAAVANDNGFDTAVAMA